MSLAILAATMTLFVLPNDAPMYVVENLSPEVCTDAIFIAETGRSPAVFEAEMAAYMRANPEATSYTSMNRARAYCVPTQVKQPVTTGIGGNAQINISPNVSNNNVNTQSQSQSSATVNNSTFYVSANREEQERAEAICRGAGWGIGFAIGGISQPGKLDKRCMMKQYQYLSGGGTGGDTKSK